MSNTDFKIVQSLKSILDLTKEELELILAQQKHPKFRVKQIYEWIFKGVYSFEEMTNLPLSLREYLKANFIISKYKVVTKRESIDGTVKLLGELYDGCLVECVLLRYEYGNSVCISTQVGCKVGCVFCASGKDGFFRNLQASEMISQMIELNKISDKPLSSVVLMGSGEPLDNLDNVIDYIELIKAKQYFDISLRSITLSTSGILGKINALREYKLPITLAYSMHNPFQAEREKIIPTAKVNKIDKIISELDAYFDETKRRITIEYVVIEGENDTPEHIAEIGKLLNNGAKKGAYHLNLIPLNKEGKESGIPLKIRGNFENKLSKLGIGITVRRSLGTDIEAACGQLKNKYTRSKITNIVNAE